MTEDKRQFQRFVHDAKTHIEVDGKPYVGQLLDLSLKGCLVAMPGDWPEPTEDQAIQISILLGEQVSITSEAVLSHAHDDHSAGFTFNHIDLDSISSLRRLVELNLGDSDVLERELSALVGT